MSSDAMEGLLVFLVGFHMEGSLLKLPRYWPCYEHECGQMSSQPSPQLQFIKFWEAYLKWFGVTTQLRHCFYCTLKNQALAVYNGKQKEMLLRHVD